VPSPNTNPLIRFSSFISRRGAAAWVNNIPVSVPNLAVASNGVIHGIPAILLPPSKNIWETIDTDPQLTYLKAAINRADQAAVVPADSLRVALKNFGLNATVFAPTDAAFRAFLTGAIAQYLISQGTDPAIAATQAAGLVTLAGTTILTNPASIVVPGLPSVGAVLNSVISPTNVKGILVYHVLSSQYGAFAPPGLRVFSANLPTTPTNVKTLLNTVVTAHPGLTVSASFTGPVATEATVKGALNPTAANIIIMPPPAMSHDLHQVNGVIHKIDQVLIPAPLLP
jgi:uncharacterized surface protein with fasciclin (FAS1) repeats